MNRKEVKAHVLAAACSLAAATWAACAAGAGGKPEADPAALATYDAAVAEARHCTTEQGCVIAGGVKGCRCRTPVLSGAKEAIERVARAASCPQVERLYCPPLTNPRCEAGHCVADVVRE